MLPTFRKCQRHPPAHSLGTYRHMFHQKSMVSTPLPPVTVMYFWLEVKEIITTQYFLLKKDLQKIGTVKLPTADYLEAINRDKNPKLYGPGIWISRVLYNYCTCNFSKNSRSLIFRWPDFLIKSRTGRSEIGRSTVVPRRHGFPCEQWNCLWNLSWFCFTSPQEPRASS